jgi:hypothetical protein
MEKTKFMMVLLDERTVNWMHPKRFVRHVEI